MPVTLAGPRTLCYCIITPRTLTDLAWANQATAGSTYVEALSRGQNDVAAHPAVRAELVEGPKPGPPRRWRTDVTSSSGPIGHCWLVRSAFAAVGEAPG